MGLSSFVFINSLGNFNFGYISFYLAGCLEFTLKDLEITDEERTQSIGLLFSAVPFGAILSCLVMPFLRQKLSRRDILIYCDLTDFLVSLILIFHDRKIFLFGRFAQGFTVGINSILTNQFIFDYAHPGQFQKLNAYLNFAIGFGCSFGLFMSFWVPISIKDESIYHNLMYLVPGLTGLIRTLVNVVVYRYDTPVELYKNQKYELCKYSIKSVYNDPKEMEKVFNHAKKTCEKQLVSNDKVTKNGSFEGFLLGIVLMSLQQLSGISAICVYANQIFDEIFKDVMRSRLLTFTMLLSGTMANFIAPIFVQKYGAKRTLSSGFIFLMTCLFILGFLVLYDQTLSIQYTSTVLIFLYNLVFNITLGPLIFGECAIRLNDSQYTVAILSNWTSNGISTLIFPLLQQTFKMNGTFWFFGAFCLVGLFASEYFLRDEKKNKDE